MRILNLTGIVFSLFMLMWGFNYSCSLIAPMSRTERLGESELYQFGIEIAENINKVDPSVFEDIQNSSADLALINRSVEAQVKARGIKVWGQPAFHSLRLNGKLRKLGIAGIYFPFTGQAYADDTFLQSTLCFIRAHELSHAYGIASEAEADFMGYLALYNCIVETEIHSMYYKFCADLELLRSIRYQLNMMDDSLRLEIDSRLHENVLAELKAIKLNALDFPEYFPGLQSSVNDRYLKIMGVEEGVQNYDLFIDLAWDYHHSVE